MTSPRQELKEVEEVLLNLTNDIGKSLVSIRHRFDQLLNTIYKNNQEKLKRNELASLQGEMHAVPTQRFHAAIENLNKDAIAMNEKIKQNQLKIRELHSNSPSSPTDAAQAKDLEEKVSRLRSHTADLMKLQEALLKTTFVTGQLDADKEKGKKALSKLQNKIEAVIYQNKVLKSEFIADRLLNAGIKLKTGRTASEIQSEQPKVKSNSPKLGS